MIAPRIRERPILGKDGKRIVRRRCKFCKHYESDHATPSGLCGHVNEDNVWCTCEGFKPGKRDR